MTRRATRGLALACGALVAITLAGCTNPDAPQATRRATASASPQSPGEGPAPPPPSPSTQAPADVQPTPVKALEAFASGYINWNYEALTADQRHLAAISVGAARLAEQQAAAASGSDSTIARGHISNSGQIVSIASDLTEPGTWVIVTREQTGGDSEYEGLQAAYHVTLAELASVPGGYAVKEWLPQT